MKYKVIIDGVEQEMDLVPVTELLKNDDLLKEAMEMRGIKTASKTNKDSGELDSLKQELSAMKTMIENISAGKSAAEQELKAYLDKQKAKDVEMTIENAIKSGKITPEKADEWKQRLTNDFDTISKIINEIPATPSSPNAKAATQTKTTTPGDNTTPFRTSDLGVLKAIHEHQAQGVN